jgi:uncharacterized membrane protein
MRTLGRLALRGLAAVLPLTITLYLLWWAGTGAEALLGGLLKRVLPHTLYVPGLGVLLGLAVLVAAGALANAFVVRRVASRLEALIARLPLLKTVYGSIKDVMSLFSGRDAKERLDKVVTVPLAGSDVALLGFLTRDSVPEVAPDRVAVYLPMSYQIGGFTVLLPRARVTPVAMSVEDAMRFTITAGMSSKAQT